MSVSNSSSEPIHYDENTRKFLVSSICILGCLFSFFPSLYFPRIFNESKNSRTSDSNHLFVSKYNLGVPVLSGVVLSLKIIFDMGVDFLITPRECRKGFLARILLISTILLPHFLFLYLPQDYSYIFPLVETLRIILRTFSTSLYIGMFSPIIWTDKLLPGTFLFYVVGTICVGISAVTTESNRILLISSYIFYIISGYGCFTLNQSYFYHIIKVGDSYNWKFHEHIVEYFFGIIVTLTFVTITVFHVLICRDNSDGYQPFKLHAILYLELFSICIILTVHQKFYCDEITHSKNALEVKRMFVRYVSHEIRTPLNTVFLGLELLLTEIDKIGDLSTLKDIVCDIKTSGDLSLQTINDLLLYDKLDSCLLKLELDIIPVWNFVKDSIRPFLIQAQQAQIQIVLEEFITPSIPISLFFTYGDRFKLSQIMRNLISNALKFSPKNHKITISVSMHGGQSSSYSSSSSCPQLPGLDGIAAASSFSSSSSSAHSQYYEYLICTENTKPQLLPITELPPVAPQIDVTGRRESLNKLPPLSIDYKDIPADVLEAYGENKIEFIRFSVTDNGPGISMENQQRLFKNIVQFDAAKLQNGGGSGLGLWISQRLAGLHGGTLSVFSEGPGCGSTFCLDIPVFQSDEQITSRFMTENIDENLSEDSTCGSRQRMSFTGLPCILEDCIEEKSVSEQEMDPTVEMTDGPDSPATTIALSDSHSHDLIGEVANNSSSLVISQAILPGGSHNLESLRSASAPIIPNLLNMLVVDDAPMNRKMLLRLLDSRCASSTDACDGVEAVDLVRASLQGERPPFDVILMDNVMPNMDGATATREIRNLGYQGIIIGVTGSALPAEIQRFVRSGANKVLLKPLNVRAFDATITDILLHHQPGTNNL